MLTLFGGIVGVIAASIGLGGGIFIIPFLILVLDIAPVNAVAVSIYAITGTTISASIGYLRSKKINFRLALLYDVFDIPGVFLGVYLTTLIPGSVLIGICGLIIIVMSLLMIRNRHTSDDPTSDSNGGKPLNLPISNPGPKITSSPFSRNLFSSSRIVLASISSFLGGFITGLAGMGGGVTDTTTMILLGIPTRQAVATSEIAMALTNIVAAISHTVVGNVNLDLALPLTLGTIIGAQFGCRLSSRIPKRTIQLLLGSVALFSGARLLLVLFIP